MSDGQRAVGRPCGRCWWGECENGNVECYEPATCPCPGPHAEPRDDAAMTARYNIPVDADLVLCGGRDPNGVTVTALTGSKIEVGQVVEPVGETVAYGGAVQLKGPDSHAGLEFSGTATGLASARGRDLGAALATLARHGVLDVETTSEEPSAPQ